MSKKYKIMPLDYLLDNSIDLETDSIVLDNYKLDDYSYFYKDAKTAIHKVLLHEGLTRSDEVYISTTSNSNFVSSCVTSTIFNYSKVSRVLTDKTKLIFVIHEFGFVNNELSSLIRLAKQKKIPVVEDTAHSFFLNNDEQNQKFKSDYRIFSIPKSLPVSKGGILISRNKNKSFLKNSSHQVRKEFELNKNYLSDLRLRRIRAYNYFKEYFRNFEEIYSLKKYDNPFGYAFFTDKSKSVYKSAESLKIELLKTYNTDWVMIPTNPFYKTEDLKYISKSIMKFIMDS